MIELVKLSNGKEVEVKVLGELDRLNLASNTVKVNGKDKALIGDLLGMVYALSVGTELDLKEVTLIDLKKVFDIATKNIFGDEAKKKLSTEVVVKEGIN